MPDEREAPKHADSVQAQSASDQCKILRNTVHSAFLLSGRKRRAALRVIVSRTSVFSALRASAVHICWASSFGLDAPLHCQPAAIAYKTRHQASRSFAPGTPVHLQVCSSRRLFDSCPVLMQTQLLCRQTARRGTAHKLQTRAAQRQIPRANKRQQQNGQAEPDEVPFLDRFHISVTGFPFPLGPFFQRRTICNEVCSVASVHGPCMWQCSNPSKRHCATLQQFAAFLLPKSMCQFHAQLQLSNIMLPTAPGRQRQLVAL